MFWFLGVGVVDGEVCLVVYYVDGGVFCVVCFGGLVGFGYVFFVDGVKFLELDFVGIVFVN